MRKYTPSSATWSTSGPRVVSLKDRIAFVYEDNALYTVWLDAHTCSCGNGFCDHFAIALVEYAVVTRQSVPLQ